MIDRIVRIAGLFCLLAAPALAAGPPRSVLPEPPPEFACAAAIRAVERAEGVPAGLLSAIALVESGRAGATEDGRVVAWPWTINAEGEGHYFETRDEANAAVGALLARDVGVVDVGCLGIDLYYHPTAFQTLTEAFDPVANATYAARYLKRLKESTGSWDGAVARYHSATPELGQPYRARVYAAWLAGGALQPTAPAPVKSWDRTPSAVQLAGEAFGRGEYESALEMYRKLETADADSRVALLGLALCLDRLGHTDTAREYYRRTVIADPSNRVALAGWLALTDRAPESERLNALLAMADTLPQTPEVAARLGLAYSQRGELDQAAGYLTRAAAGAPDDPMHRLNLALVLDRRGDRAGAVTAYEAFLRLKRNDTPLTVSLDSVRQRLAWLKSAGS